MTGLIAALRVDEARMAAAAGDGYTTATSVADTLVELGVPFRAAHHIVGRLVAGCGSRRASAWPSCPTTAIADALRSSDDPAAAARCTT